MIDDQLRPAREDHALRVEVPEQIGAMFLGHYRSLRQYGSPARVVNTTEVDFSRNALPVERSSRHFSEFRTKDHFVIVSLLAANDLPGKSMRIAMKKNRIEFVLGHEVIEVVNSKAFGRLDRRLRQKFSIRSLLAVTSPSSRHGRSLDQCSD